MTEGGHSAASGCLVFIPCVSQKPWKFSPSLENLLSSDTMGMDSDINPFFPENFKAKFKSHHYNFLCTYVAYDLFF